MSDGITPLDAATHEIQIVSSFLSDGYTCECSCGWISDAWPDSETALFYGREHQQREAQGGNSGS